MNNEKQNREGIENGRAAFAFEKVQSYFSSNSDNKDARDKYRSYVKKLPSMIQVNGLGQTLAFCFAKGDQYHILYQQMEAWVKEKQPQLMKHYNPNGDKKFVETVVSMPSSDYRLVSCEVLSLLDWMRRFADGLLHEK